jgi:hypothetical protein
MVLLSICDTAIRAIVTRVAVTIRLLMYVLCGVLFLIPITVIAMGVNVKHLDKPYVVRGMGYGVGRGVY